MPLRVPTMLMVGIGAWGAAGTPHGSCQRVGPVLWAEGAQEEHRMGMVGRKGPGAGRQVPVESMLPPGCVTLGK